MTLRFASALSLPLLLTFAMTPAGAQQTRTQTSPLSPNSPAAAAGEIPATCGTQTSSGNLCVTKTPTELNPESPGAQPSGTSQNTQPTTQLPDAPSVPLTNHQKFNAFLRRTYSPYTFSSAALNATWAQAWGDFYSYGGGMQGWSKRFGASLANTEIRNSLNSFLFPVIFKQDPRYFPSHKNGIVPRLWYAGTRVFVARSDTGRNEFNWSELLGALATVSIQNAYYPTVDRGFPETMQRFGGTLGSDAGANALREFTPDIKRILRRILPKKAQKLEEDIPEPIKKTVGVPSLEPQPKPKVKPKP